MDLIFVADSCGVRADGLQQQLPSLTGKRVECFQDGDVRRAVMEVLASYDALLILNAFFALQILPYVSKFFENGEDCVQVENVWSDEGGVITLHRPRVLVYSCWHGAKLNEALKGVSLGYRHVPYTSRERGDLDKLIACVNSGRV